ncbi:ATP-binding cassette domain-containing protein [Clostridium intestinale]|uniref:Bacitracin ABC transporter ATP-binding protein n=2 Tax=Clostridium intestinale TaxID=36845 RepID=U2PTR8_9CLOT|nr:ATP-binding cassette domain-containing protein [Clostridium intestinale]ERK29845.1 bacitracin ABC transporter ATP-binding protein [Clostridium intestinale URNW]QLY81320.1 ATP-binding cassette domain-containing protein [Clostridium intestinale]
MNDYALTAKNIKMQYGVNTIFKDISIHVERGAIYALVGKNGSGKTTLLRILTGLINDFNGTVSITKINGCDSKLAAVINDPSLFLNMSALENMKEQAHLLGLSDNHQIEKVLKTVGLSDINRKPVKNFSLGMTQRLKLAMALIQKPDILILDEPMNGLDPNGIADLRKLLLHLNESGITILISSHILSELEQIATHLGILHDGRIVKEIAIHYALQNGTSLEKLYMQYTMEDKSYD